MLLIIFLTNRMLFWGLAVKEKYMSQRSFSFDVKKSKGKVQQVQVRFKITLTKLDWVASSLNSAYNSWSFLNISNFSVLDEEPTEFLWNLILDSSMDSARCILSWVQVILWSETPPPNCVKFVFTCLARFKITWNEDSY